MDGPTVDHSDSDSGESWTLLENHPVYGDDAPDFSEKSFERDHTETHIEKDEDTDGISIISDSDPESAPCDTSCDKCFTGENRPSNTQDIPYILNNQQIPNSKKNIESLCNEDDFMEDGSVKLKTYVHKRNKRLSMVLNIIMLGSVITAAGVAIGHMWGAKNECAVPIPSVNKILSNLYKLQEENAYLRNRLKELTLAGNIQAQQIKSDQEKRPVKQNRCKKMFEEPLNNNNAGIPFKCVDHDGKHVGLPTDQVPIHEKEFLNDIGKLKYTYNQNKIWLDEHIERRLKNEYNIRNKRNIKLNESGKDHMATLENIRTTPKLPSVEENDESTTVPKLEFKIPEISEGTHNVWKFRKQVANYKDKLQQQENKNTKQDLKKSIIGKETKMPHKVVNIEKQLQSKNLDELTGSSERNQHKTPSQHDIIIAKVPYVKEKISYADSLKTDSDSKKIEKQNDSSDLPIRGMRGYGKKRKLGVDDIVLDSKSSSDDQIPKDDRYTGPKIKRDKNKYDRHKLHKKQKRRNKYEQWEMKGGYLKDFDEFSMTSSKVNLGVDVTPEKKYLNQDFEHYLNKFTDDQKKPKKNNDKLEKKGEKGKDAWFDKRHNLRAEARRKLEHELFGETSLNHASWYFRRMNKREQCRAQKDNTTFKKLSKQKMNYKMKH